MSRHKVDRLKNDNAISRRNVLAGTEVLVTWLQLSQAGLQPVLATPLPNGCDPGTNTSRTCGLASAYDTLTKLLGFSRNIIVPTLIQSFVPNAVFTSLPPKLQPNVRFSERFYRPVIQPGPGHDLSPLHGRT